MTMPSSVRAAELGLDGTRQLGDALGGREVALVSTPP
jgi:hypothetical protein